MHAISLDVGRGDKSPGAHFLQGGTFVLLGIALVEALLLAGGRPLTPLGWPGIGLLAAAAFGGAAGLTGGSAILTAYYSLNFVHPIRFPEFYGSLFNTISWVAGLALVSMAIVALRPRVVRALARERQNDLQETVERLHIVADNVPALISYIDAAGCYRFSNQAHQEWFTLPREAIVGRSVRDVLGERYTLLEPSIRRALRGERVTHEYAVLDRGVERHILANYVPDFDRAGRVKGILVLGCDVSGLAEARTELRVEQARLKAALRGSNVASWDTDLDSGRIHFSEAWADFVGPGRGETVMRFEELAALVHPDDIERMKRISVEVVKGIRPTFEAEHRIRARNGEWKWILCRGAVTERDPHRKRALRMAGTCVDITERRHMEEAVHSAARTDPLTGLANRMEFGERLRLAHARSRRNGGCLAVLYLDIDRFKAVNDRLGHAGGDAVLKAVASRLRACVRATDTVSRFGGDEFVVLVEDVKERESAITIAEKVVQECRRPMLVDGSEVTATTSIGLAYGDGGTDEEWLLKRADAALYEAKAAGRDCWRVAAS